MKSDLLRLSGTVLRDPAIDIWFEAFLHGERRKLGTSAQKWFEVMRGCGDEVREVFHDGCPNACLGDVPFCYVNVFTAHMNVGFFRGAWLSDPVRLLEGSGKQMRHVKLRPGSHIDDSAIHRLIAVAYSDIKAAVERD